MFYFVFYLMFSIVCSYDFLYMFCTFSFILCFFCFRYVSFDPLGNWLLTGISNTFGTSAFVSGASSSHSSGPSTLGGPPQVPNPIPYRLERNEQERERNLQSRYQVSAMEFSKVFYFHEILIVLFNFLDITRPVRKTASSLSGATSSRCRTGTQRLQF